MGLTSFIWFLLIGLVAGWLAGKIMRGSGFGVFGNIAIGVIGSFIGGWLFSLLGVTTGGTFGAIITAMVGAMVLLYVVKLIKNS
ncbi:MAG: GlsB/YeaQ/YmgE family stress response membrane protein [Ignavibacteriales bacterium]|nr:MAG: GlsB/YeaQ/YmgE family stress response membrane protein [Ignavibacteriales bacterium]